MRTFSLPGLETDNLLAFMALLGLLRALDRATPKWFARAHFSGTPLIAQLTLSADVNQHEIAIAAAAGCAAHAGDFEFHGYKDLTFEREAARDLLQKSLRHSGRLAVLSALFSDGAVREDERILPTAFCAMFGQGHQNFLERLENVAHGTLPRSLKGKKQPPDVNDPSYIERALFKPWTRSDSTDSFRWDFQEDRRYALRAINPSNDAGTTEHGANRLAILGLISFQSAPATDRIGRPMLATRAVSRNRGTRNKRITWPIWSRPAPLESIHMFLDEYELSRDYPDFGSLIRHSISQARRVQRISVGKFINFTRAEALLSNNVQEQHRGTHTVASFHSAANWK